MRSDIDNLLLDRLFQPLTDRAAGWITCFGLARASLTAAVLLQFVVLVIDLSGFEDPLHRVLAVGVTVIALFGAQQTRTLIARAERQTRVGTMNVRRITMRWQRLAWLGVTMWAAATGLSAGAAGLGVCGASLAWLGLIYFVSCTPAPPRWRRAPAAAYA